MTEERPSIPIARLVRERKVIVCCGAGGVGKTTVAAALAVAGARAGRRTLVLTIDPSRRLAEALGVSRNPVEPVPLPADRLAAAGIPAGMLDAWMLDPKLVADRAVERIFTNPGDVRAVLDNKIYSHLTRMVAGMHEYMAMEALHRFVAEGRYELVVLDTPPSRHALDFLDAPGRLAKFLEGRIFRLFLPEEGGLVHRTASSLINQILRAVFGEGTSRDLVAFFALFGGVFSTLGRNVSEMRAILGGTDSAFLLVTSPAPESLREALFFQDKTRELGLPFEGFVLNRSLARAEGRSHPRDLPAGDASPALRSGLEKLSRLADEEREQSARDQGLLAELATRAQGRNAVALPYLSPDETELGIVSAIARELAT